MKMLRKGARFDVGSGVTAVVMCDIYQGGTHGSREIMLAGEYPGSGAIGRVGRETASAFEFAGEEVA